MGGGMRELEWMSPTPKYHIQIVIQGVHNS